jgi:succinyl-CoA synthetase beta subunit
VPTVLTELTDEIRSMFDRAAARGWLVEPEAKRMLERFGLPVPRFGCAATASEAAAIAGRIGYPVVGKIVSPVILHKSDVAGVIPGIATPGELTDIFHRFEEMDGFTGMLVEEMLAGVELIVGATIDEQFGPVILLGIGGTSVEIYQDVAFRMAPLKPRDIDSMVACLKGRRLIEGFRGRAGISMSALQHLMAAFSDFIMTVRTQIASVDLNPVMCTATGCTVADARIVLRSGEPVGGTTVRSDAPEGGGCCPARR